jgi:hypothetical protein
MSKDKKQCNKCNNFHHCDDHHILPKALFGEGETVPLCKNCHDELHLSVGHKYLRKENKQSMEFYIEKYLRWLVGLGVIIGLAIILF